MRDLRALRDGAQQRVDVAPIEAARAELSVYERRLALAEAELDTHYVANGMRRR